MLGKPFCLYLCVILVVPSTSWMFERTIIKSRSPKDIHFKSKILTHLHQNTGQQEHFSFYEFDGATISYRTQMDFSPTLFEYDDTNPIKKATSKCDSHQTAASTLLLIHPIGIGQASWFWERFMTEWFNSHSENETESYNLYAVNLLGCGPTTEQNAMWNTTKQTQQYTFPEFSDLPVSLPLMTWVEQCEAFIDHLVQRTAQTQVNDRSNHRWTFRQRTLRQTRNDRSNILWTFLKQILRKTRNDEKTSKSTERNCTDIKITIVSQGGLAPVAVLLAARNPALVQNLVLLSPPTYRDMTTAVPRTKLQYNYRILCNEWVEKIAFNILESQWVVRFFSNLFLFSKPCDDEWLDRTILEIGSGARRPVQLFNAGYCSYRSYHLELSEQIIQPTLILRGNIDNRYCTNFKMHMADCRTEIINGKNVLPWESSPECCRAIKSFLSTTGRGALQTFVLSQQY
jgi:pimeloyl-ACP methyl ester carboxylesterase